jgi:hypothetical protein
MSVFLQPIYTQTLASTTASIIFNNIPQGFTDLKVVLSCRDTASAVQWGFNLYFNGNNSSIYSSTYARGSGTAASSGRLSSQISMIFFDVPGSQATANTFSNTKIYIPNYTSSNFKSVICDSVMETNNTTSFVGLNAGLSQSTAAITSVGLAAAGTWVQYTTATLYGITRG